MKYHVVPILDASGQIQSALLIESSLRRYYRLFAAEETPVPANKIDAERVAALSPVTVEDVVGIALENETFLQGDVPGSRIESNWSQALTTADQILSEPFLGRVLRTEISEDERSHLAVLDASLDALVEGIANLPLERLDRLPAWQHEQRQRTKAAIEAIRLLRTRPLRQRPPGIRPPAN